MVEILGEMKILSLPEAEQLKKVLYPEEGWEHWIKRARWLSEARELYGKGFAICVPENILWDDFKGKIKDLGVEE